MLPFRQVGASETVTTSANATAAAGVVLVSNPAATGTAALYFSYGAAGGTAPSGQGVPVLGGQSLQIATPGSVDKWYTTGALIVTPIEILRT